MAQLLDTIGCARGAAIETFTGRLVDITCIKSSDINCLDIAHSLSQQCRFGGHSSEFMSVAEHSVNVMRYLQERFHNDRVLWLAGLLHDASEAYLVDVPRPVKHVLAEYASLERDVQTAIHERFGITVDTIAHDLIKEADNAVLKSEAESLMPSQGAKWGMESIPESGLWIACLPPKEAETLFLKAFVELM